MSAPNPPKAPPVMRPLWRGGSPGTAPGEMLLSILIHTLTERKHPLNQLLKKLEMQIGAFGKGGGIEILVLEDDGALGVGEKKNILLDAATGRFIVFMNDGDDVSDDYVTQILSGIAVYPEVDCIGMRGALRTPGMDPKEIVYSLKQRDSSTGHALRLRSPQHVTPVRRQIAAHHRFPDVQEPEDSWSMQILPDLRVEHFVDKIIHSHVVEPVEDAPERPVSTIPAVPEEKPQTTPTEKRPPRPDADGSQLAVSAVLSIHNRSTLLARALKGYLAQTMPPDQWEIILVDDMSTEDLSSVYAPYAGRMNLRHVKMDHTKHPVWKERHPHGSSGTFENWFHTPSISINMGCYLARGTVICLCHPEILHKPENFELAHKRLGDKQEFLFGKTFLGTPKHNKWLSESDWTKGPWQGFLDGASRVDELHSFGPTELYWYTSFLPKSAVVEVGGVDFTYLHGTCAEDDDFKDRVALAGRPPLEFPQIQGFHQDHSDEKESHRNRTTKKWEQAMARNRSVYGERRTTRKYPVPANAGVDWTGMECFVEEAVICHEK